MFAVLKTPFRKTFSVRYLILDVDPDQITFGNWTNSKFDGFSYESDSYPDPKTQIGPHPFHKLNKQNETLLPVYLHLLDSFPVPLPSPLLATVINSTFSNKRMVLGRLQVQIRIIEPFLHIFLSLQHIYITIIISSSSSK